MFPEIMDLWGAADHVFILLISYKVWFVLYGLYFLSADIFLTLFPTTLIGALLVFGILNHFRVPPPPPELVNSVFGEELNVLMEAYEKERGQTGPNGLIHFPFIPTTSRLALSADSSTNPTVLHSPQNSDGGGRPYTMWTVAHRGAGLDCCENSLSAFRLCKTRGCTAVEFDVALTKDGVPVIFHDDTLERMTGIDGNIRDMTYRELEEVDISVKHPLGHRFQGERIPTLDEAITTCLSLDLRFFIDLKDSDQKVVEIILEAYERNPGMYNRAVVSSFFPNVVYHLRRRNPRIIGCLAWRPGFCRYETWNGNWEGLRFRYSLFITDWGASLMDALSDWTLRNLTWWFLGLSAILFHKDSISKEGVCRWVRKGIRVYAWTVNSPLEKLHLTQNLRIGHLTDTLDGGDLTSRTGTGPTMTGPQVQANGLRVSPVAETLDPDDFEPAQSQAALSPDP